MKNKLLLILIFLFVVSSSFVKADTMYEAQENNSVVLVQWKCIPPDSQKVSYENEFVTGISETGTSIFRVRSYTGASGPLGPTQRWWPHDGSAAISWGNESEQNNNRYVQFAVIPKAGRILHADNITLYLGGGATSYMKVNIYYDTRASFKYPVKLNSEPIALLNNVLTQHTLKIDKNVYPGDTLYVRVYPWYESSPSTSKYLLVQDVNIYGTTSEITASNAPVNVKLPTVAGTLNSEKTVDLIVDDVSGKNIISFQGVLSYDKNIIEITEATNEGTILEGKGYFSSNANIEEGKVTIAWAGYPALVGEGSLVKLKVKFKNYGTTTLDFANTLKFNLGIPGAIITGGEVKTISVLVQGGTVSAIEGENIVIPILTTEITADHKIRSYEFTASFDNNILEITDYDLSSTLSENGMASINVDNNAGTVRFSLASGSYITGSGTLLKLNGKVKMSGSTEFVFDTFRFNTGTPISKAEPAQIFVSEANRAPSIALSPAGPYTVNENETITITVTATDPNAGDVLTYSATNLPQGATFSNQIFSWKPVYDQSGSYTVTFKVTDKDGLSATVNAVITVNNVNRAPSFTAEIPDGQVVQVHNVPVPFEFIYKAEDPDGDKLIFKLVSGPGEISTDGYYTWAPSPSQAGLSYILIIEVSDGSLTAISRRMIKASSLVTGVEESEIIPTDYVLLQNYPNPFNPTTTIKFGLPEDSNVKLIVYNVLGQEIVTLINGFMNAGYHSVNFDASMLNTGIYIYKIQANDFVAMKKMIYVK